MNRYDIAGRRGGRVGLFALVVLVCVVGATLGCGQTADEQIGTIYDLLSDPTEENIARIRERIDDPDRDVRVTALNALVLLRVYDAERLAVDHLSDGDGFVRATAAKLVGDLENPAHASVLVDRLLEDSDPVVRQRSAEALERLGGEVAVEGLARALDDPLENVRLASIRAIRKLGPAAARASLVRLLLEDPEWEIRVQAAKALANCEDPTVVPALESAAGDTNEFVRSAVASALASYGAGD